MSWYLLAMGKRFEAYRQGTARVSWNGNQYTLNTTGLHRCSLGFQKGPKKGRRVSVGPILLSCCSCPWATSAEKQSWQLVTKFFFIKESFQLFIGKGFPFFQLFRYQLPGLNGRKSSRLPMLKFSIRKPFQKVCSFHLNPPSLAKALRLIESDNIERAPS